MRNSCFFICLMGSMSACCVATPVYAPVSIGELIDKITILEIKMERILDTQKRKNIQLELETLLDSVADTLILTPELTALKQELIQINEQLWEIEDKIRAKEVEKKFDEEFIQLARDVYRINDQRARVKRMINELSGSSLCEEKQYTRY